MKRMILALLLFLMITGCRHGANNNTANDELEVSGADLTGADDPLETEAVIKVGSIGMNIKGGAYFLRGYVNKSTSSIKYQLYIQTKEMEWRYWDSARFLQEGKLKEYPVTIVGSKSACSQYGCGYFEDVVVNIDRSDLVYWSKKDMVVRLSSSRVSGNKDIEISDGDSKDFLNAMDQAEVFFKHKNSKPQ